MQPYAALRTRLDRGEVIVLDGPMGSELVRRGVRWRQHGLRTDADKVESVHLEYLQAGADVLRTNTFQLNRRTYQDVFRDPDHMRHIGAPGLERRVPELIPQAVALAKQARARAGSDVPIAGVISPLEHCFRPDLAPPADKARVEHAEVAQLLAEAGVDFLILESFNTVAEARAAVDAARQTGLPVWLSFVPDDQGNVLSGEPIPTLEVDATLVNCAPPEDIGRALGNTVQGAYAHIGKFDPPSWKFEFVPQFIDTDAWPPERYAEQANSWIKSRARIVGGCCGTTAEHVRALKRVVAAAAV